MTLQIISRLELPPHMVLEVRAVRSHCTNMKAKGTTQQTLSSQRCHGTCPGACWHEGNPFTQPDLCVVLDEKRDELFEHFKCKDSDYKQSKFNWIHPV